FRPDPERIEQIRRALVPIPTAAPAAERGASGFTDVVEGQTYEQRLRAVAPHVIKSHMPTLVEGRGPRQHTYETKTLPTAAPPRLGTGAQEVVDARYGGLRAGAPLRVDSWWRRGNIHDRFAALDSWWARHTVRWRRKYALIEFIDLLSFGNELGEARRKH